MVNPIKNYKFEKYVYEHKQLIEIGLAVLIFVLLAIAFFVWNPFGGTDPYKHDFPTTFTQ